MTDRHNVTMQFVDKRSYKRLCVLAHVWGKTLGDTIMQLLDEAEEKKTKKYKLHTPK